MEQGQKGETTRKVNVVLKQAQRWKCPVEFCWWHLPVIQRWRQEDRRSESSLVYTVRPCLKNPSGRTREPAQWLRVLVLIKTQVWFPAVTPRDSAPGQAGHSLAHTCIDTQTHNFKDL